MGTSDAEEAAAVGNGGACAPDDLDALQISDSLFPTGMFASSGGLELMFARGMVTGARELSELCRDLITHQVGVGDCVALANAYDAASLKDTDAIEEVDAACCSAKTVREARDAYVRSGVQLCRCVAEFLRRRAPGKIPRLHKGQEGQRGLPGRARRMLQRASNRKEEGGAHTAVRVCRKHGGRRAAAWNDTAL